MDISDEVRRRFLGYTSRLKQFRVTDNLWVVDTWAWHAINSDSRSLSQLGEGRMHTFEYGKQGTSSITLQGTVRFNILNPRDYYDTFSLQNVAFDKECGSKWLNEVYYLPSRQSDINRRILSVDSNTQLDVHKTLKV
ncbi:Reticuline oxidase-like [Phytophthora palmivora]|uniref:Reticuline oxidase-like n=1 Tax=Phytophthora palmivora TaxID=4796 RepID=A0A2P4XVY0_9STRA|nr:Reticuline oxidase-like [Phytophthora palmivora]